MVLPSMQVALNYQGKPLAVMEIESRWQPNKALECKASYGFTTLEVCLMPPTTTARFHHDSPRMRRPDARPPTTSTLASA